MKSNEESRWAVELESKRVGFYGSVDDGWC